MITDWLMVVITFVYVVATICICVFNAKSAKAAKEQTETTKKQIELMIQQYNETNRPMVSIYFDLIRSGLMCFVIENIGSLAASDLTIRLNEEFIKTVEANVHQSKIRKINQSTLFLAPRQKVTVYIAVQTHFSEISTESAIFDISYNNKYNEHIEINLAEYGYMLVYGGELADISQH